jgi:hypothetical protein
MMMVIWLLTRIQWIFISIIEKHQCKVKGVATNNVDFFCNCDDPLAWGILSYAKKMRINYELMFGENPTAYYSPMI